VGLAGVRITSAVSSPGVYGLLRPVLLLPQDIERRLTPDELDAVVAHEMAHVRRRDNLTTAFHMVVTALVWFHPFVWWIGRQLVNERERASDEAALGSGHSAEAYAEGLLKICRASVGLPAECVAGISSSNLKARVEGIMRHHEIRSRGRVASVVIGLVAIVVVAAPLIWGLSTPEFTFAAETPVTEPEEMPRQEPAETVEPAVPVAETGEVVRPERVSLVEWLEQEAQTRITDVERRAFESLETVVERERVIGQFWLRREASPGGIWVEQEVPYIITAEERDVFESLEADEERERFIEQFWLRRDPTPGTGANEFRDEHYRRIAYANETFGFEGTAGWRTDRGALYIIHGEPDAREARPDGGAYFLPASEGGGRAVVYPFEQWRYRYIEGVGEEIVFEFVDAQADGNYRLALTPRTKIVGEPGGEAFTIFRALREGNPDDGTSLFRALRGAGVDAN
jgi:GWxTD domain-containing protein